MGLLLHLAATAAIVLFVWSSLHLASVRVPRAGQVEFALWLLSSDRAANATKRAGDFVDLPPIKRSTSGDVF